LNERPGAHAMLAELINKLRFYKMRFTNALLRQHRLKTRLNCLTPLHANSDLRGIHFFVINLNRDTLKRQWITRQFSKLAINNYEFFTAYDGKAKDFSELRLNFQYNVELAVKYESKPLSDAIIALSATHHRIYEEILTRKLPLAVVLEDDAIFVDDNVKHFSFDLAPTGWDILLLEAWLREKPPLEQINDKYFGLASYKGGSAAYIITDSGASKLLNMRHPLIHPPDGLFRWYNIHSQNRELAFSKIPPTHLNTYLYYPCAVVNGSLAGYWPSSCDGHVVSY
jgi:GR25 family glycosyltransferase involved in LPS biosynthesis